MKNTLWPGHAGSDDESPQIQPPPNNRKLFQSTTGPFFDSIQITGFYIVASITPGEVLMVALFSLGNPKEISENMSIISLFVSR